MTPPAELLSQKAQLRLQLHQLLDAVLLVFSLLVAYLVGLCLDRQTASSLELWLIIPIVAFGPLLLELHENYNLAPGKSVLKSLWEIIQSLLWLGGLIATCAIAFGLNINNRSILVLFPIIGGASLLIKTRLVLAYQRSGLARQHRETAILASSSEERIRFTDEQLAAVDVVEWIDVIGQPPTALADAIHRHSAGRVIFPMVSTTRLEQLKEAITACEIEGVEACLMIDCIEVSSARPVFDVLGAQPVLVFRSAPGASWALVLKRAIDLVGSGIGLLFISPLLLIVAVAIKLTSPGPVFFTQLRGGRYGRPFKMYKFRSMYVDAAKQRQHLAAQNEVNGPAFKIANDPRITPLGRYLRRYSIDELPQLINVFFGQMSLVGPRPLPVYEIAKFADPAHRRRMSVKPGLTCLWQITGRSTITDFKTWVELDVTYIDNFSIWLDLKILLRTIPAVLFGKGAV
jgi:exopolysaccharide biosynthesis polyprenyl glycosylphosphotransferase